MADSPGEKPLHLIIEEFAEYQVLEPHFFQDLIFRSQVYERCHIHICNYPIHVFALVVKDLARKTKESDEWITWSWPWSSSGQLQHFACSILQYVAVLGSILRAAHELMSDALGGEEVRLDDNSSYDHYYYDYDYGRYLY